MACSDCEGDGTCREDHGGFDTRSTGDIIYGDDSCEPNSDWEFELGVNPLNGSTETYDEVEGSYKHIWLNSFFSNTPDVQITSSCEDQLGPFYASPESVEYYVRHPSSESTTEYEFEDPRPDGDGNWESWVMDSILDIAGGVSSSTYVGVGAALLQNFINTTNGAQVEPYDNDRQVIHWDIDIDGGQDFATAACDSTGSRFDIVPGVNSGTHDVNTWVRYNFTSTEYRDGYECVCDTDAITGYGYTTDWLYNSVSFEFK